MDAIKSHLKQYVLQETSNRVDITSAGMFPNLNRVLKGVARDLKKEGKAETTHYPPIPTTGLIKIFGLIGLVTRVFQVCGTAEFVEVVKKIPQSYRQKYHVLLQISAQFILAFC